MAQISAIPFCCGHDNDDAPRALPLSFTFSTASSAPAVQTFKKSASDCGINSVEMVYIDASQSPAATTIILGGTRQTIVVQPFTQGYYRVLNSSLDVDFTIVNFGGVTAAGFVVNTHWLNVVPDGQLDWLTQSPAGLVGTPFAANVQAAATSCNPFMAAVTGRRSFVTSISFTSGGATAASVIQCYLSGLDNVGAVGTLYFELGIPAGATLAMPPFTMSWSPGIPVLPGQIASAFMPSAGAGNTAQAATLTGYYI